MTEDKDFKRQVRRLAATSGESYQQARQRMRPDQPSAPPDLDALTAERRAHWSEETRRRGGRLAHLALRMADGKPVAAPPPAPPDHVTQLRRTLLDARDTARRPDAPAGSWERVRALESVLEQAIAIAWRETPVDTPPAGLQAWAGTDLDAVLCAREACREPLTLNPRDHVARAALASLDDLAHELLG